MRKELRLQAGVKRIRGWAVWLAAGATLGAAGCAAWRPASDPDLPPAAVVAQAPRVAPQAPALSAPMPPAVSLSIHGPPPRTPAEEPVPRPSAPPGDTTATLSSGSAAGLSFRSVLAVQTVLDRYGFSCGCLDGCFGPRTREALRWWQAGRGLPATGELDPATLRELGSMEDAITTYLVTQEDILSLAPVPATWEGKAAAQRLGYETVLEAVAEKFHASEAAIRRLNPDVPWPNPPAGTAVSAPNPFPSRVRPAESLTVDLSRKTVRALDANGRVIALFPCSVGTRVEERPTGEVTVVKCAANPEYLFDPALFADEPDAAHVGRKLLIPAGPNNPVGTAWIGLSLPGYGIHGTPRPEDVGKTESHGCFRLANWNAERLLRMVRVGMPVRIER